MKTVCPKGILIPIGGGEDRFDAKNVLSRVIHETGKKNPRICLITLATSVPKKIAAIYKKAFDDLHISNLAIIHFSTRDAAETDENLKIIKECDLIMFSGGKQLKLTTLLGGTKLLELMKERYFKELNFVIAGTSAGAAAMSNTMITSGNSKEALIKGTLDLTNGLDLINDVSIDTHFTQRGRIGRLLETVTCNPGILGIGLGEDTCVIIRKDKMETFGSGVVTIVDGTEISYTNISDIKDGMPISVQGIKVHILVPGLKFDLKERRLEIPNAK